MRKFMTGLALAVCLSLSVQADEWLNSVEAMPGIGHASIEGGALILFPDTSQATWSEIRSKVNTLCKKAATRGLRSVVFLDPDAYATSGEFKIKHRKTCIG
jgi:opacity protein-like surface antigen